MSFVPGSHVGYVWSRQKEHWWNNLMIISSKDVLDCWGRTKVLHICPQFADAGKAF